ncbi:MAG TPA: T9SS type A sorting domain-containing protein, partial [Candidatus Kapabacteria bacterium]|nr:T9SS type A sorting domain-containing protein [Candidatus Kapabacteria bacterium]
FFADQSLTRKNMFTVPPTLFYAASAVTGNSGTYSIQVDSGASYVLLATAPGHQSQFIGSSGMLQSVSPFTAPIITPTGSNTESAYNGNLSNSDTTGQQIVGTVKSMENSSTGVHAMIMLLKSSSGTITAGYSGGLVPYDVVSSDNAGNFSIPAVPRDTMRQTWYFIQAIPFDGYIPTYFAYNDSLQNKILWENAKIFQLSPDSGAPYEADVTVPPIAVGSGTISGTITEPTDSGLHPSSRTFVYAIDQSAQNASAFDVTGYAVTDTKGNFTIGNLPVGSYALIADKVGFQYGLLQTVSLSPDSAVASGANFSLGAIRTSVSPDKGSRPGSFTLSQNYPDPFTEATTIQVNIPDGIRAGDITLNVYDMLGRLVSDLSSQLHVSLAGSSGVVRFVPRDLPSGVYIYRLQGGKGYTETKQMLLVR